MKIRFIIVAVGLFPLYAQAEAPPIDPSRFVRLEKQIDHGPEGDYCYMESAYRTVWRDGNIISMSIIWNHDKNTPLKCSEYYHYAASKAEQYKTALKEYRESFPAKEIKRIKK